MIFRPPEKVKTEVAKTIYVLAKDLTERPEKVFRIQWQDVGGEDICPECLAKANSEYDLVKGDQKMGDQE